MKRLFLALAVLTIGTLSAAAQNTLTKEYKFDDVTRIIAHSVYSIEVTQGKSNKVTIEYDERYKDRLVVNYVKGRLELAVESAKNKGFWNNKKESDKIKVYMQMPSINEIELSGAASLQANGNFKTNELEIDLSGATSVSGLHISGDELSIECSGASKLSMAGDWDTIDADCSGASKVSINADAESFEGDFSGAVSADIYGEHKNTEIECSGAAKTMLEGNTKYLKATLSGASSLKAEKFETENGYTELTGASNAKIRCTGELKTMVSRASSLTHYGNTTIVNMSKDNIKKGD